MMGIFSFDESETYLEMDNKIKKYEILLKKILEACPAGQDCHLKKVISEAING
jgi:hypothetical protein